MDKMDVENDEQPEESITRDYDRFAEKDYLEILTLIDGLSLNCELKDDIAIERSFERFQFILDQYQELPHLLDQHLDEWINKLLAIIRPNLAASSLVCHEGFKWLWQITKVRGYKIILRHLPHEVSDFVPTLAVLERLPTPLSVHWESRYMLLVWLTILLKIPFDLHRFDSNESRPLMARIVDVATPYLSVFERTCDVAARLLAIFLTRPDVVKESCLVSEVEKQLVRLKSLNVSILINYRTATGIMQMLSTLFKFGRREDLLPLAPHVLAELLESSTSRSTNSLLRKLFVKLLQRIGLTFLRPRIASWRYKRGSRSLAENLASGNKSCDLTYCEASEPALNDDESFEAPPEIEIIIEHLLQALQDRETVVRWSGAKGIGRIASRLTNEYVDQLVSALVALFNDSASDSVWHGGCLAMAELARRGFLLPFRLSEVVPLICRALVYEELRGKFSVGAHVRDAACYVCWAFARAYDPVEIKQYIDSIAQILLCVALFDREVTCRRAASAAFQENVGRQGAFPNGIEIVTLVDYFAVGNRNYCCTDLCAQVAIFPTYTAVLVDHLLHKKVMHWDEDVRLLAARALGCLTPIAPQRILDSGLAYLVPLCLDADLYARQGALFALSEIIAALRKMCEGFDDGVEDYVSEELLSSLLAVVTNTTAYLKQFGGDLMRVALSMYIESLAKARLPCNSELVDIWQSVLSTSLSHLDERVRLGASAAIGPLCFYYRSVPEKAAQLVNHYCQELQQTVQETSRMGAALGLAAMPQTVLHQHATLIFETLIWGAQIHAPTDRRWAEARRDCISSLSTCCATLTEKCIVTAEYAGLLERAFACYQSSLDDYTLDSRGDIGTCVREAGLRALKDWLCMGAERYRTLLSDEIVPSAVCLILQQSSEKIDRTRAVAADAMRSILFASVEVPNIPERAVLCDAFSYESCVSWMVVKDVYPRLTSLLAYSQFRYFITLGFVVSAGGLSEGIIRSATDAFLNYIVVIRDQRKQLDACLTTFVVIFEKYQGVERVSLPLMKLLDQILMSGYLDIYINEANSCAPLSKLLQLTIKETAKTTAPNKLLAAISVWCGLLQFEGELCHKALVQLLVFLTHKLPRIRKETADQLYQALLTYSGVVLDNHSEHVLGLLDSTDWFADLADLQPVLIELKHVFCPEQSSGNS